MIPRVAKLGTGFVGAGLYYMNDKRPDSEARKAAQDSEKARPSAAEYFLTDKGPLETAERVGFTATRNLSTDNPMKALRQMAFTAAHAHDIRVAAVAASAKAAGMSYDAYVKATNPFRGRKGQKPVYSLSLSFEPGDPAADKETMLKAADEVRHVLGLQDHQCLIVQHTDTKHPHVHLIINRVHPTTGKYASAANDRLKLSEWALAWEKRHGKIVCPAREPNHQQRAENRDAKAEARARGDMRAKAGYVKSKGLPPSEIEFWRKHGSADLAKVRAARAQQQKRDYEEYRRVTARKLDNVDYHHACANGRTLRWIDQLLERYTGRAQPIRFRKRHTLVSLAFDAVRGLVVSIASRLAHRSDIAKLVMIRTKLRDERLQRRDEVMAERRKAFEKMQRIHAWQNWLDEKRCRSYRDSDTREWRDRRDRWDVTKAKAPLFGSASITFYDVAESKDQRQAREDRRKLLEPLEMKRLSWRETPTALPAAKSPDDSKPAPPPIKLPDAPTPNQLPFVKRDPVKHAAEVAESALQRMAERGNRERTRRTGRKRQPRPR
jgi:hypothetical protein